MLCQAISHGLALFYGQIASKECNIPDKSAICINHKEINKHCVRHIESYLDWFDKACLLNYFEYFLIPISDFHPIFHMCVLFWIYTDNGILWYSSILYQQLKNNQSLGNWTEQFLKAYLYLYGERNCIKIYKYQFSWSSWMTLRKKWKFSKS